MCDAYDSMLDANQQVEVFNSKLAENRQNSVRVFDFINEEMHCCCVGNGEYWQLSMLLLVSEKKRGVPVASRKWQESRVSLLKFPLSRVVSSIVVCQSLKRNIIRSLFTRWREIILLRVGLDHFSEEDEYIYKNWRKNFLHFYFLIVFIVRSIRERCGLKYFVRLLLILARF